MRSLYQMDMTYSVRRILILALIAIVFSFCVLATIEREIHEEFCQWDVFNISCSQSQLILVLAAHYGRMKVGRCIPIEYETGCKIDVLSQLEERCSGRQRCSMAISDSEIFRVQPCRKDLVPYLEIAYKCVEVSGPLEPTSSSNCDDVIPIRATSGYLSSRVTETPRGAGSERCPWSIEARPGQRLAITVKSFAQKTGKQSGAGVGQAWSLLPSSDGECVRVAEVRETLVSSGAQYLQVCPGDNRKSATIYVSTSNRLQLKFVEDGLTGHLFLVHYEVVGCPDVSAPQNAWLTRNGDNLVVVCNYTTERWYIACSGRDWASQLSNCSAGVSVQGVSVDKDQVTRNGTLFPFGLLMAVTVGAIIGISIGFGCLLVLCVGRKRWKERRLVQNAENSNRESVYKLIDFWAKPEMRCDCAMLHPEMTCECAPPELHHLHRQVARENLARYVGGGGGGGDAVARWESDGRPKRCLQDLGSHHRWDVDRGPPDAAEVHHYDEALFLHHRHRTTTTALQRCTCSSGKCRHEFIVVDDDDGHQHNEHQQHNGEEKKTDDQGTDLPTVPQNSSTTPTKSETRTETSFSTANSPQRTSPEQPAS